ncbi:MAG: hypothetical protein ABI823_03770, partial [Bryobacteraceae bacterium]
MPWLLPVVAALVALLIVPGWSFAFDVAPKLSMLFAGLGLSLLFPTRMWTGAATLARTQRGKWLLTLLGLTAASLVISSTFSLDLNISLFGTAWRRFGLWTQLA